MMTTSSAKKSTKTEAYAQKTGKIIVDPNISITPADSQFLNIALTIWNATKGHDNIPWLIVPTDKYMQIKGIPDDPQGNNRKNTNRQIKKMIDDLRGVEVQTSLVYSVFDSKGRPTGKKEQWDFSSQIVYGKAERHSGGIYMAKMTDEFFKAVSDKKLTYVIPLPLQLQRLDTSKHKYEYFAGVYLNAYAATNKTSDTTTKMNTLLEHMSILKKNNVSHAMKRIIKPTIEALDGLQNDLHLFNYKIVDSKGKEVKRDKLQWLSLDDFKRCKLKVKWLEDRQDFMDKISKQNDEKKQIGD